MSDVNQTALPRWRGFNLLDLFTTRSKGNFSEDDFRWMRDWGFDFVRVPACYTLWIEDGDPYRLREPMMEKVDRVVRLGQTYGIHIDLNFHRGPGYSVNGERREPYNLWKDQEALDAFVFHWEVFTRRYRGIPSKQLSFNLINEPQDPRPDFMTVEDHARVIRTTTAAIRAIDPERWVIIDGTHWGNTPSPDLVDLGVGQSCRAYLPMGVSHYKAGWVSDSKYFPEPRWPGAVHGGELWNRAHLESHYRTWAELSQLGVGVHCGEGGAFNQTPHPVVLAWFRDVLEILSAYNIGYALWNFRGSFGILDSGRADVDYEDWHGHKLDRQFLELLRAF